MDVPVRRISLAEGHLVLRLALANADPREAGVGNVVNCGAAMYMAPVGIVNAGDPQGAYDEAIGLAGAHQSSYGREAAGVLAAAVSAAMQPDATLRDVLAVATGLARDGTAEAIEAVLEAATRSASWEDAVTGGGLREAVRPFDSVGDDYAHPGRDARRPSRVHSIEELPIALGMLLVSDGEPWPAILGSVNYGRDADSIAAMAGAVGGALSGHAVHTLRRSGRRRECVETGHGRRLRRPRGCGHDHPRGGPGAHAGGCRPHPILRGPSRLVTLRPRRVVVVAHSDDDGSGVHQSLAVSRTGCAVTLVRVPESGADSEVLDAVRSSAIVLLPSTIPSSALARLVVTARLAGAFVVLHAARHASLSPAATAHVDLVVTRETADEMEGSPRRVVILPGRGARVVEPGAVPVVVRLSEADDMDEPAADDVFAGALVAALCKGLELVESTGFAVAARHLANQRHDGRDPVPTQAALEPSWAQVWLARSDADGAMPLEVAPRLTPRVLDLPAIVSSSEPGRLDDARVVGAPSDPAEWPGWRDRLVSWRADARRRLGHDGAAYRDPDTAWASTCYVSALIWLWDERLFDHERQEFTPERLVTEADAYGGFDAVILWQAYPVVGIDQRTQFDFYREVPGLDAVVEHLRRQGIRVLLAYNPWDDPAETDAVAELADLRTRLGADGVFLDTMAEAGSAMISRLRAQTPPAVLEGENNVSLARIADHQMSWAKWFADSPAPGVVRAHWYERGHMTHQTRRWHRDHSDELHCAWMNGTGMVVWDVVFGSWVGWNERDRSMLRATSLAQRALSDILTGGTWTPLVDAAPQALEHDVYASRWETDQLTLWTVVNRSEAPYHGSLLQPSGVSVDEDQRWLEVISGTTLGGPAEPVTLPPRGIAGIVCARGSLPARLVELMAATSRTAPAPTADFPVRPTRRITAVSSTGPPPSDAIVLPAGEQVLTTQYRIRECGLYDGAPFVDEWRPLPPRLHGVAHDVRTRAIGAVAVAAAEVSAADYATYLSETGRPSPAATPGDPDAAASRITLREARAYAASRGARMPTEFEWQLAATQPGFIRREPWVWNWTESEHSDGVTRWVILKGGCDHLSAGSHWYFDGGRRPPDFSAKLLLAGLGVEASPSIGFRLAWDLPEE